MRTLAIVPVKDLPSAKRRLAGSLADDDRRALVAAMLTDVLEALQRARSLDGVLVVSPDVAVRRLAAQHGALAVEEPAPGGHDEAVAHGMALARELRAERVACLAGDCPLLDPAELDRLLERPRANRHVVVVPDRHGTGTNALVIAPADVMRPSYGPDSLVRHRQRAEATGIVPEVACATTLALDVDTPADLALLRRRLAATPGARPRTSAVLERLPLHALAEAASA